MTKAGFILKGAALAALLGATGAAGGADVDVFSNASLAASFDTLLDSARSQGLAGAFSGEPDEAVDMLQNPACLAQVMTGQVSLQHHDWIGDVTQENVLTGIPLGYGRGLGLEADFVNYGFMEGRDAQGNLTRPLGASDLGVGAGYGQRLWGPISGGLTCKTLHQTLADRTYDSFSADAGLLLEFLNVYRVGLSYANFGTPMAGSRRDGDLLMSASFLFEGLGDFRLLLGTGFDYQPLGASRFRLGLEPGYKNTVFLRCGYQMSADLIDREGQQGFSLGAGFRLASLRVDWAYSPFGDLGAVQRLGLSWYFNAKEKDMLPPPPLYAMSARPQELFQHVTQTGEALELYFQLPQDPLADARELARQSRTREAVEAYIKLLGSRPLSALLWKELGAVYQQAGWNDYAQKCFQLARQLVPPRQP